MGRIERTNPRLLRDGPIVEVDIGPPPDLAFLGRSVEPARKLTAIINTASHASWIDLPLLNRLGLKPNKEKFVPSPEGGRREVGVYNVAWGIRFDDGVHHVPFAEAYDADFRGYPFVALIGRSLLHKCGGVFSYNAITGWYMLKFGD